MFKKILNIQWVAVLYTLIGLLLVEIFSKYPWAEYSWILTIVGVILVVLFGWISKIYLEGNLYLITITSVLYIVYWFVLFILGSNIFDFFNLKSPALSLNYLPMSINLVYFWLIIMGGIIGYIAQFRQRRRDYKRQLNKLALEMKTLD